MRTEIRYAVGFALIVIVYVMIEHFLGFNTTRHDIGQYTRLTGVVVPALAVFFGIRAKRQNDLNGAMTFGQGVKAGAFIALVLAALTMLWFWLYSSVINPHFVETMLQFETAKLTASGASEAAIGENISGLRSMYSFPTMQIFLLIAGFVEGLLAALVSSLLLRKGPSSGMVET